MYKAFYTENTIIPTVYDIGTFCTLETAAEECVKHATKHKRYDHIVAYEFEEDGSGYDMAAAIGGDIRIYTVNRKYNV